MLMLTRVHKKSSAERAWFGQYPSCEQRTGGNNVPQRPPDLAGQDEIQDEQSRVRNAGPALRKATVAKTRLELRCKPRNANIINYK